MEDLQKLLLCGKEIFEISENSDYLSLCPQELCDKSKIKGIIKPKKSKGLTLEYIGLFVAILLTLLCDGFIMSSEIMKALLTSGAGVIVAILSALNFIVQCGLCLIWYLYIKRKSKVKRDDVIVITCDSVISLGGVNSGEYNVLAIKDIAGFESEEGILRILTNNNKLEIFVSDTEKVKNLILG